jgi:hypothetical protein
MKKLFFALALTATGFIGALSPPTAAAVPGQCWNSPFGGFCDTAPLSDGSYQNCITFGGSSYCSQVCHDPISNRAVPTDMDMSTPC